MVILTLRKSNENAFSIEVALEWTVRRAVEKLVAINNLRMLLKRLGQYLQELVKLGFQKPQQLFGTSYQDVQKDPSLLNQLSQAKKVFAFPPKVAPQGFRIVKDKNNRRQGIALTQQRAQPLLKICAQIKERFKAQDKIPIQTEEALQGQINDLKMEILLVYGGYEDWPIWEPLYLMLQDKVLPQQLADQKFPYFQKQALLWFGGKVVQAANLAQFIKNQKSKLFIKLQNAGGEMPVRQPPVDNQTYRKMVKYYYKKTDQQKKLEEASMDTQFMEGQWTKGQLKSQLLNGGKPISFKP